jgi:hypothetical protein
VTDARLHLGQRDMRKALTSGELLSLLKRLSIRFERVMIVVDALDECTEVTTFIQGLQYLSNSKPERTTIKVLVTSRKEVEIERLLYEVDRISVAANIGGDIYTYVSVQVDNRIRSKKLRLRDPLVRNLIVSELAAKAHGMSVFADHIARNLLISMIGSSGLRFN